MDMKLLDRLYNRKFWLTIGVTAGLTVYFGIEIVLPYFSGTPSENILVSVKFMGLAATALSAFILSRDDRIMKKDPSLREALDDERMRHDRLKACRWGCMAAFTSAFLMGSLSTLTGLPLNAVSASFTILLATFLGMAIPLLIYMKK